MNRLAALLAGCFVFALSGVCHAQADAQWPFYRHDLRLTARSRAVGNLTHPPEELWKYYLGGWKNELVITYAKGHSNRLTLANFDTEQKQPAVLTHDWRSPVLVELAGDGKLTPSPPGKIAKLLPGIRGLQQVVWEHPPGKPTRGIGRCYSFENGADKPRLLWETEEEAEVYELLWTIADLDGDKQSEVVFMTHYRILVYDGQTGKKKSTLKWPIGRNYGQMTLADVDGDRLPEVVVVVDSPPHVDVLKYAPEKGKLLWSHRYITDAQVSLPIELKLRLIPNHVRDIDGDGRVEIVYNLFNADGDFKWHIVIRDALTGKVKHDLPGLFVWGLVDLHAAKSDGPSRPMTLCCLEAAGRGIPEIGPGRLFQLREGSWHTIWQARRVRWQMKAYSWPLTEYTIASLGPAAQTTPHIADVDEDGRPELFITRNDRIAEAIGMDRDSAVVVKWSVTGPPSSRLSIEGSRRGKPSVLLNVDASQGDVTVRNGQVKQLGHGRKLNVAPLPSRPLALVADMEGDGTNEVIVQDSQWRTRLLRFSPGAATPREILRLRGGGLWLGRRWAGFPYSKFPVFTFDLTGDGRRELLLTDVAEEVISTVTCLDVQGKTIWKRPLPSTASQSIVWMAAGRFTDSRRFDLLVVVQSGSIGECFCLRGDLGEIIWRMGKIQLADGTPFNFGSHSPFLAVADFSGDGLDDICGQSGQYVAIVRGKNGKPLVTPRNMIHDLFPRWVNYGLNVVGDWDGSGRLSMFTNTSTNGFGLLAPDLRVRWFTDRNGRPLIRAGSIGRMEHGGGWTFGTFAGKTFKTFDMKTGMEILSEEIDASFPSITSDVICADVDGDHRDEFLAASNDLLICVRADRQAGPRLKWKVRLPTVASELAFADADNDGHPEIIYTGADGYVHGLGRP